MWWERVANPSTDSSRECIVYVTKLSQKIYPNYGHLLKDPSFSIFQKWAFCYFSDKTQEITSIKQLPIYATYEHKGKTWKHFIGILPISQMGVTTLFAESIMKVLEQYFEWIKVSTLNSRFLCMDTTNVNLGGKKA